MVVRAGALTPDQVGSPSVASFALNAAAPMMVVGAYVTTAWAVTGTLPIAVALLGLGAILAVWCVGYVRMARHVVNAGSLYTTIAHGIGAKTATTAAAIQLVAYTMLQVGLYGIAGVQATALAEDLLDLTAPWWLWALAAWAAVAALGTRGVGVSSKLLAAAMAVELVVVAAIITVDLTHPHDGQLSLAGLDPTRFTPATLAAAIAIAVTAFIGIEAAPTYSEEARQPRTTIMVATYLALTLMVAAYVLGAWAMTVAVGPQHVIDTATRLGPDMLLTPPAAHLGGHLLVDTGHLLILTSILAGLLSYHNTVARTGYALARDGILPGWLARTAPRTGAPAAASLTQSATGLTVIVVFAAAGWDPLTQLFFWLGTTGALGILILMATASIAVIGFFHTDRRGETRWATLIAPALAAIALTGCLLLVLDHYATLLGVATTSPARWALPAVYLTAATAGTGYAHWLATRRPWALDGIGRGANAAGTLMLTTEHTR